MGQAKGNATLAAKIAEYSDKTAYSQGQRLLKNVEIRKAIEEREKECPLVVTWQELLEFWSNIMRGEVSQADGKQLDTPIRLRERIKASELLGKSFAIFKEKVETTLVPFQHFLDNLKHHEEDEKL